ncbi:hypothetical protein VitviT2T_028436 [Vitis vinifera]|uniref:Alliinase C-terminal domain-containing protein n=1 Tax=Vitis vinifera TaxID=29760 RepID=A0ABY9DV03_VITVI|nr:hypothetical protein VitviT2T_028436 [Vitis vinifera]
MQNAANSAVLVAGWHRMSYRFDDQSFISQELERLIRRLHASTGNAITEGRFILFGAGSTQLINAAVHALSPHNSSAPAKAWLQSLSSRFVPVPAFVSYSIFSFNEEYALEVNFYVWVYQQRTDFFRSVDFQFQGDTSLWKNNSDSTLNLIEVVTAPDNPDGQLNKAVLHGPYVKAIHDHAYYWPHFTAIPAPADEDLMIFTLSKLTGHAGTTFGWALIKDESVYQRRLKYKLLNVLGVSRDTQLRALKLLKLVLEGSGREIFKFSYTTMKNRREKLNNASSVSDRFSIQKIAPQYCTFFQTVRGNLLQGCGYKGSINAQICILTTSKLMAAYAWLKCEREEEKDCHAVLIEAGIVGRDGTLFGAESSYVRLSLIKSQDDFDILLHQINKLVAKEDGHKSSN